MRKVNKLLGVAMTGGLAVAGLGLTAPAAEAAVVPHGCEVRRLDSAQVRAHCNPVTSIVDRYRAVAYCRSGNGSTQVKFGPTVTPRAHVYSYAICSTGYHIYDDTIQYS